MDILYISSSRVPSRAANSIHVMKMCAALAENNHNVYLVTAKVKSDIEYGVNNIYKFYGVKKNFTLYRLPWLEVKNFAFIYAIQIIFIFIYLTLKNHRRPICYGRFLLGLYLVSFLGPQTTLEVHAGISETRTSEKILFSRLIKKRRFKRLVVISKSLADYYIDKFPELKEKIVIAHDGADDPTTNHSQHKIDRINKNLCNLGYVGHLYQGRGVRLMLDIVKNNEKLHLHLIGGTEDDIKYWKDIIESENIKNITLYGFLHPSETHHYRNNMDILLAPYEKRVSISGGNLDTSKWMSPLKIFEYMSACKPIICSDLPVLHEVLSDGVNCLFCKPESANSWIEAVEKLRNDKALSRRISLKAFDDFKDRYTWKKRAELVISN